MSTHRANKESFFFFSLWDDRNSFFRHRRCCCCCWLHFRIGFVRRGWWDGRVPHGQQGRPNNTGQQYHIQLMSDGRVLEIDQLDGDPKGPLGDLRFPQDVVDPLVDLGQIHPLHRPHGGKVDGITDPRPVHELFHKGFEDGDVVAGEFQLDRDIFQKVVVHVRHGRVNDTSKQRRPSRADIIVREGNDDGGRRRGALFFIDTRTTTASTTTTELGYNLCYHIPNAPQEAAGNHFGEDGMLGQALFVPFHKRDRLLGGSRSRCGE